MCGIIGLFDLSGRKRVWPDVEFSWMVENLLHRGPDGSGQIIEPGIALGHTRLAVLDLSDAGRQPMESADRRLVISYNGEIYNFQALRDTLISKGHHFDSECDTEVILASWREWGTKSIDYLQGMFAFAIYDRHSNEMFLVRDRLGIKPLFYFQDSETLAFSSEPMALFGPIIQVPDIEPEDIDSYFTFNYLAAPRSGLKGCRQLKPGHFLHVKNSTVKETAYWSLEYPSSTAKWGHDLVDRLGAAIDKTVTRQLVADVPVGVFLSGGLDSFSVANAARENSAPPPSTFTLGFSDSAFDESAEASQYANHLGLANHCETFKWDEDEILRVLSDMKELHADPSCFPINQLSHMARQHVIVALSGDGGDELLAGYDTYRAGQFMPFLRMIPSFLRKTAMSLTPLLPSADKRYGTRMIAQRLLMSAEEGHGRDHATFRRIFSNTDKQSLYAPDFLSIVRDADPVNDYARLIEEAPSNLSFLKACQRADLIFHLPSILAKVDRMSMAHGLEVRVPLLDEHITSYCLSLPDEAKRHKGLGKRILRDYLKEHIPQQALSRPKAGFLPPVDQWFRTDKSMMTVFGDFLSTSKNTIGWLNWDKVDSLWKEHQRNKIDAGFTLLGILQFMNWETQLNAIRSQSGIVR